ncbi:MAG: 2-dehydro-3-deoxygalactonokinase, partial [Alphaproteobacteria bacterium]|nr:2-dehydro-3-deoxygalactonokinase [Alphaproteobacteria bacterium]
IEDDKIVDFHTVMTGEMFGILSTHGSLAPLFRKENQLEANDWHEESFSEGITLAQQDHGVLSNIWQVRSRKFYAENPPKNLTAFLSGILIGHELRHAEQNYPGKKEVVLLADADRRREYYHQALGLRGWKIIAEMDSETAVCTGLLRLL